MDKYWAISKLYTYLTYYNMSNKNADFRDGKYSWIDATPIELRWEMKQSIEELQLRRPRICDMADSVFAE